MAWLNFVALCGYSVEQEAPHKAENSFERNVSALPCAIFILNDRNWTSCAVQRFAITCILPLQSICFAVDVFHFCLLKVLWYLLREREMFALIAMVSSMGHSCILDVSTQAGDNCFSLHASKHQTAALQ